jgi:flagellar biosynthesis regulator FlaF
MEAICSSETSVETQRTIWRHIPEDDTLHNHLCENLKYNIVSVCVYVHAPKWPQNNIQEKC